MARLKVISYFSYKGGAGRSTLAFNTIPILAKEHLHPTKDHPIILIDTDLDSCGMSYLVKAEKQVTHTNCIQHLLGNPFDVRGGRKSLKSNPFISQLIPVGNAYGYEGDNEAILLLPAMDGQTIDSSRTSNYSDSNQSFKKSMDSFIRVCDDLDIPAVIFDSAVGNNATANISNEESDVIVCCMRPTLQFTNGTFRYLAALEGDGTQKLISDGKHIVLVPNVIPQNEVVINNARYPDTAISKICNDFISYFDNSTSSHEYHFDMLDREEFGIPAVDRFMWREGLLHNQTNLTANEQTALQRYKKLAEIIYSIETE
jgi:cellulose biosynthesis protein BcsQ